MFWRKKKVDRPYRLTFKVQRYSRPQYTEPAKADGHGNAALWITYDNEQDTKTYRIDSLDGETGEKLDDPSLVNMWFCFTLHLVKKSTSKIYQGAMALAMETAAQLITQPELLLYNEALRSYKATPEKKVDEDDIERIKMEHDITKN